MPLHHERFSSASIRISEAVASLVQRYCRKASTTSRTTIPDRINGQKLRNPLYRRRREGPSSEGFFFKRSKAHSQPQNEIAAGMPAFAATLRPENLCERGELLTGRNQLTFSLTGRILICISHSVKNRE